MQSALYHSLKNNVVRDLYWVLFSASPLSDEYDLSPFSLFPRNILDEWQNDSELYFLELDKYPNEIERFVNRRKNRRLGFYAEALLSFYFQTFPNIDLLLQNFQVNEKQITIGEIDFIILYKSKVIHLECSTKYYMLRDIHKFDDGSQWVGPKLKDNLEKKLNRIIGHQIPLGLKKAVQEKINKEIDYSYLLIKGVFFAEKAINPGRINSDSPHSFIRISDLENLENKAIKVLSRPNWLSSFAPSNLKKNAEPLDVDVQLKHPIMYLFDDGKVRFVVPDEWGV